MNRLLTLILIILSSSSASSQNVNYEIYALKFTAPQSRPLSVQVLDASDKEMFSGVFMFWFVREPAPTRRGDNGKKILVDAGFLNDCEEARSRKPSAYVRPDSMLLRLGVKAEEITDVIISHPHWDHVDGVDLFPNAKVWIQKEDYIYFVSTAWQPGGYTEGFNKRDVSKLVTMNMNGKLNLIDGDDKEILPGIRVYTGSKHTFSSQYVLVKTGTDKIIIASDNAKLYYNLEHLKSVPKNATFDTNAYVKAMERMKVMASDTKFVIPGHDALLFSRFPAAGDGIVRIK